MTPRSFLRCVAGAAALALLPALGSAQSLSLGEQYALRSYTGQAMGQVLAEGLKLRSLGVVTNNSSICSSLSGAIGASFLAHTRGDGSLATTSLAKPEDAAAAVASLAGRDGVALVFGGQVSAEDNAAFVKATLQELARSNYPGAIFFHLRVWVPQLPAKVAAEDAAVAAYLSRKNNLHTVTINPQTGKALVHRVQVQAGQQASAQVLQELAMNDTWLTLFKRSL